MTAASAVAGGAGWGRGGQAEAGVRRKAPGKAGLPPHSPVNLTQFLKKKLSLLIEKIAFLWLPCWGPAADKKASEGQGASGAGEGSGPADGGRKRGWLPRSGGRAWRQLG